MIPSTIPASSKIISQRRVPVEAKQPPEERCVIALVGMAFEADIASGQGVFVVRRNSENEVAHSLDIAIKKGARGIISFGVAGGLAPQLRPGDLIVASSIIDSQKICSTDPLWSERLLEMIPGANYAPIMGVETAITDPTAKRRLHLKTGAVAVDMESHLVARLGSARGLSFAALRVVIDPAHRRVPESAIAGMRPDGGTSATGIMRALVSRPSELPGLLRIAIDAYVARSALLRVRRMLGPGFGLLNLGEV